MNSKLEFLYLEVGAFRREVCGDSPIIDKWMYALKNLSRLEERPAALRERVFARLFEAAKIAAYTKEERNQYENDMMTENDYRNTIARGRSCGRTCRNCPVGNVPRKRLSEFQSVPAFEAAGATGHRLIEHDAPVEHVRTVGHARAVINGAGFILLPGMQDNAPLRSLYSGEYGHPVDGFGACAAVDIYR